MQEAIWNNYKIYLTESLVYTVRQNLLEAAGEIDCILEWVCKSNKNLLSPSDYMKFQTEIFHLYKAIDEDLRSSSLALSRKIEEMITNLSNK